MSERILRNHLYNFKIFNQSYLRSMQTSFIVAIDLNFNTFIINHFVYPKTLLKCIKINFFYEIINLKKHVIL